MESKKVNLFVVGAMKAGTTSFLELLSMHNQIYAPPIKEPHFFIHNLPKNLYNPSRFFSLNNYFENEFPNPIHIAKIETLEQYNKLYELGTFEKYRVDASTAYLHAKESAGLVHEYNSNAKIIILIRDPLKRAFSHYKMNLAKGREMRSFESVMTKEIELYENKLLSWHSYLGMSLYNSSISRYLKLFEDVFILNFEDMVENTSETMISISRFLKIDNFQDSTLSHSNQSKSLKFQNLFYLLKQIGLDDYFSKYSSTEFRQWIFKKITKRKESKLILSDKTRGKLNSIFIKESGKCYY